MHSCAAADKMRSQEWKIKKIILNNHTAKWKLGNAWSFIIGK